MFSLFRVKEQKEGAGYEFADIDPSIALHEYLELNFFWRTWKTEGIGMLRDAKPIGTHLCNRETDMKHFTPNADKEEDFFYLLDEYFERMNCVDGLTELEMYGWFEGAQGKGINIEVARCVKSAEKPHCKEPSEIDTFL